MADYPKLWIRTITGTVSISDLGIIIDTTGRQLIGDVSEGEFTYDELSSSDDLRSLVGNGNIQWSEDGAAWTLSHQDAGDILSSFTLEDHDDMKGGNPHDVTANDIGADNIITEINTNGTGQIAQARLDSAMATDVEVATAISNHHAPTSPDHDDRYATETELATSGQAAVHWGNVTNKPSLFVGSYDPAFARVLEKGASSAPSGSEGDFYLDNSATPKLYKYTGGGWVYQFDVETSGVKSRFIDLNDADESIFSWAGSTWTDHGVPAADYKITVRDDGDLKQAVYAYNSTDTSWKKIADVDWGVHDLDDAYDDMPTNQKIINVDDGPVDLNQSDGYSPMVFNEKAAKPTNNPAAGKSAIVSVNDVLYKWDNTRQKWLSVQKRTVWFGVGNNGQKERYLPLFGIIPGLKAGTRLSRNATLLEIVIDSETNQTCDYKIAKKASPTSFVVTININGTPGGQSTTVNIDFNAGDIPIVKMEPTAGKVDYPVIGLTFAYRL